MDQVLYGIDYIEYYFYWIYMVYSKGGKRSEDTTKLSTNITRK